MSSKAAKQTGKNSETKSGASSAGKVQKPRKAADIPAPTEAPEDKEWVILTRVREPEIAGFVYGLMAETGQTMQDLLKMMIVYCAKDKSFKVPTRVSKTEIKQREAKKRKLERILANTASVKTSKKKASVKKELD